MNRLALGAVVMVGATVGDAPLRPPLPYVHGLDGIVLARATPGPAEPLPDDAGCGAGTMLELTLAANLIGSEQREQVTASFAGGVTLRAPNGDLLAHAPGLPCVGAADELDAVAVGRLGRTPILVVVATTGGFHEASTTVTLYRPGVGPRLEAIFTGLVATRERTATTNGGIWLEADGLLYRPPPGGTYHYTYDPVGHTYVPVGRVDREVVPHVPRL